MPEARITLATPALLFPAIRALNLHLADLEHEDGRQS